MTSSSAAPGALSAGRAGTAASTFGLLRSLGTTPRQVLFIILGEVRGVRRARHGARPPIGWWAAAANVKAVDSTITNLYLLEGIEALRLPASIWLLAAAAGLGGALAGALLPALDMSRRDTRSLLAGLALHERMGRAAGVLFAAVGDSRRDRARVGDARPGDAVVGVLDRDRADRRAAAHDFVVVAASAAAYRPRHWPGPRPQDAQGWHDLARRGRAGRRGDDARRVGVIVGASGRRSTCDAEHDPRGRLRDQQELAAGAGDGDAGRRDRGRGW